MDDERHRALRLAEEYRDSEKKSRKKQRDISRSAEDENQRLQVHNSYILIIIFTCQAWGLGFSLLFYIKHSTSTSNIFLATLTVGDSNTINQS